MTIQTIVVILFLIYPIQIHWQNMTYFATDTNICAYRSDCGTWIISGCNQQNIIVYDIPNDDSINRFT